MGHQGTATLDFVIEGMTCASCVARVGRALRAVPGVQQASVNLASEHARVTFLAPADAAAVERAIQTAGYGVASETRRRAVEGMTCASCVSRVEQALRRVPGVIAASVNLASESASVTRLLDVAHLDAGYDRVAVVRDLSFTVDAGEVVALLGPNGAGKTTTLATISGLLPVLAGTVEVLGAPPDARRPQRTARRGVAHVPEDRALFRGLTVRENLRLGSRSAEALDRVLQYFPELERLLDRKAGLLSGGEQQMLALGRALASGPRLLMVDEMSLGLAPIIVERILPVIRRVVDDTGAGVLLVEQHVHMALEVADRAVLLNHGEVVLEGAAADLRHRHDVLTASYLGS